MNAGGSASETLAAFAALAGQLSDENEALEMATSYARTAIGARSVEVVRDADGIRLQPESDRPLSAESLALLDGMARILALRLETMATLASLRERQALLVRLSRIQQSITSRADLGDVFAAIVEGARDLLDEANAALRLIDPEDPEAMEIVSAVGFSEDLLAEIRRGRVGEGAGGRAISEQRLVLIEDYETNPAALPAMPRGTVQAAMAAPVRDAGKVVGSLVVASYEHGRRYSEHEQEVLRAFADHASIALTDSRMVANAVHQSVHDALTGLPNRTLFGDRVAHALTVAQRHGTRVAVMFLDLDRFKLINDVHGHHAGDQVLIAAAQRLRGALRAGDTVARLGGDEFAVLLEDVRQEADAIRVAESIAALFSRPFEVSGREHFVSTSVGIALSQESTEDHEALLRNADAAMYRAKARGRATWEVFDEDMRTRMTSRMQIESDLLRALDQDQLRLVFQPIIGLPGGELAGAEALLRWEHPERGVIPASEFVPVAEETGLIDRLGAFALERACALAADWHRAAGRAVSAPWVAVNLSPAQLTQPRLAGRIASLLAGCGLPPEALVLEITENVLLDDAETPRATLTALSDLGVRLFLDDFGTGYASLSYLRRLPLSGLKIDRSFIRGLGADPEDTAIVEAITGMARGLKLSLIAEGVETPAQLQALLRLGCPRAQGHQFSRPLTPDGFLDYLLRSEPASISGRA